MNSIRNLIKNFDRIDDKKKTWKINAFLTNLFVFHLLYFLQLQQSDSQNGDEQIIVTTEKTTIEKSGHKKKSDSDSTKNGTEKKKKKKSKKSSTNDEKENISVVSAHKHIHPTKYTRTTNFYYPFIYENYFR